MIYFIGAAILYAASVCIRTVRNHRSLFSEERTVYDGRIENIGSPAVAALDSNGVILTNLDALGQRGISGGTTYYPLWIAFAGLYYMRRFYETGERLRFESAKKQGDYFVRTQNEGGGWTQSFDIKNQFNAQGGAGSALVQASAISLLCHIFKENHEEMYVACANRALQLLLTDVENGGLRSVIAGDRWFYEEAPSIPPSHILNGFVYALFALHDIQQVSPSDLVSKLFHNGVSCLECILNEFDTGFWTRYSLGPPPNLYNHYNLAAPYYQKLHHAQLALLYERTGNATFKHYSDTWKAYDTNFASYVICASYVVFRDLVDCCTAWKFIKRHVERKSS
ncbi:MAG TPA: D-glucuronyl C5-epimerase family protein [Bacteroidota bacterium]|nr:D-glucuronyl C5-epimerase family protein [Bacteroidota bacterium]